MAEDPTQIDLSPYAYVGNDPILKDDPDGNCPSCIIGAIVGAGLEYVVEVGTNVVKDGHFSTSAFTNVSVGKIALAGLAGAVGGGIGSSAARLGGLAANLVENAAAKVAVKAAVNITGDVVSSVAGSAIQGNKITAGSIASDVAGGIIGRGIANKVGAATKQSPEGKRLAYVADRARRVGGSRNSRILNIAKTAKEATEYGAGKAITSGAVGYGASSKVLGAVTNSNDDKKPDDHK